METAESVTLHGKRDSANAIKVRDLKIRESVPDYLGRHGVPKKNRGLSPAGSRRGTPSRQGLDVLLLALRRRGLCTRTEERPRS